MVTTPTLTPTKEFMAKVLAEFALLRKHGLCMPAEAERCERFCERYPAEICARFSDRTPSEVADELLKEDALANLARYFSALRVEKELRS